MQGLEKLIGAVLVAIAMGVASPAASDVGSRAIVQDDGTLRINGKTVHLYGGFVYCKRVHRNADGSETAICRTGRDREDLAAWLLYQGWAVARPGAPIEYVTLERFAKANHRGFWGFQADSITFRRPQPR
jgi:hypothetical protein